MAKMGHCTSHFRCTTACARGVLACGLVFQPNYCLLRMRGLCSHLTLQACLCPHDAWAISRGKALWRRAWPR